MWKQINDLEWAISLYGFRICVTSVVGRYPIDLTVYHGTEYVMRKKCMSIEEARTVAGQAVGGNVPCIQL